MKVASLNKMLTFVIGGFFCLGQKNIKSRQNLDTDPAHSLSTDQFFNLESTVGLHSTNLEFGTITVIV